MKYETLERIIRWFRGERGINKKIYILGGEPLLSFDLIVKLSNLIRRDSFTHDIILRDIPTNGILITEKIIELAKYYSIKFAFSLDGYFYSSNKLRYPDKRIFQKILKNIRLYMDKTKLTPLIKMTVHPENANSLFKDVKSFLERNLTNIKISPVLGIPWTKVETDNFLCNFSRLLKLHKKMKLQGKAIFINPIDIYMSQIKQKSYNVDDCRIGEEIVFTPSGDAYACPLALRVDNKIVKNMLYLGSIYKTVDRQKMYMLRNYRICSELKLECRYQFPVLTCKKICMTFNFKTGKRLFKESISNLIKLENEMFLQTYKSYF